MRARCLSRLIGFFSSFCRCAAAVLFVAALWPNAAGAQPNSLVPLAAEALTHTRDGAVEGCGLRFTGGHIAIGAKSVWLDLSINVYRRGVAIVQALAYEIDRPRYEVPETPPQRVPVQRAWIKSQAAAGSTRLGETTEVRDSLVYRVTFDDAAAVLQAVASDQAIAMGVRPWGRPRETVLAGHVTVRNDSRARIADCLTALVN